MILGPTVARLLRRSSGAIGSCYTVVLRHALDEINTAMRRPTDRYYGYVVGNKKDVIACLKTISLNALKGHLSSFFGSAGSSTKKRGDHESHSPDCWISRMQTALHVVRNTYPADSDDLPCATSTFPQVRTGGNGRNGAGLRQAICRLYTVSSARSPGLAAGNRQSNIDHTMVSTKSDIPLPSLSYHRKGCYQ